jgi:ABC-type multidrug transport system ATPase subunit
MSMDAVIVKNIVKTYADKTAVDDVSFSVKKAKSSGLLVLMVPEKLAYSGC